MEGRLGTRLVIWGAVATAAALALDLLLNRLGWENSTAAIVEAGLTAGLVAALYLLSWKLVIKPLGDIEETTARIKAGDLTARSHITSSKEMRVLSESINSMVEKLSFAYEQARASALTLEKAVETRTQAVTLERDKLSAIFNSIPDGLVFIGVSDEIIEVNPVMAAIWGVKACDIIGIKAGELTEGPLRDALALRRRDPSQGMPEAREVTFSGRHYKITGARVMDDSGALLGEITAFSDITEEKLLDKRKADFLSLVTHDLKSPLTSIMGYSDLVLDSGLLNKPGEAEGFVRSIKQSGGKLLDMVEQFLDLSRIDAGMLSLKKTPVNPGVIVEGVVSDLMPQTREKRITLTPDIAPGLSPVLMDKEKMERVVSNLVSNAVKFTPPEGRVTVCVREVSDGQGPARLEISVADTGYGIPEEDLSHIFDRYYRSGRSHGIKGSGLGLAIVKSLVEAHGGKVSVESRAGEGAVFRVRIPVET